MVLPEKVKSILIISNYEDTIYEEEIFTSGADDICLNCHDGADRD